MEAIIVALIAGQTAAAYFAYRERKSLLNAVVSKSSYEFQVLERTPRRKKEKVAPIQEDAGIPFGL